MSAYDPSRRCPLGAVLLVMAVVAGAPAAWAKDAADAAPEEVEAIEQALGKDVTQGALRIVQKGQVVECPLKHTDVKADISGFTARVTVTQTFHNPTEEKIEAVYVFPLPHEAAVDRMTMVVGDRRIVGVIQRRDEARRIYEQALLQGQTAALLEQERPNIFRQSVGNIEPGQDIHIEISYVDVLAYDMGEYEFHFPMVVGPRYSPGAPTGSGPGVNRELEGQVAPPPPNTTRVPDAGRINPPVLKPGHRTGHDISLSVSLDAGVPVQNLAVDSHKVHIRRDGESRARVELADEDTLPNKDFVLRYDVVGEKPQMAVLAHTGKHSGDAHLLGEGYFMLMIQPKEDEKLKKSPPREIVFLVDVSGSMSGAPTEKVKATMKEMLGLCREDKDTLQVITFAGQANQLFKKAVPVNEENIQRAVNFTQNYRAGGGTEMLKGVKLAIDAPTDPKRLRIVVMLTDGYIGNEAEIIEHVGKHCGDAVRFWAVGIGSSPNMFLIDGVARQGGGMGQRLGLKDDEAALAQEVVTRIQRAQLANVEIDWGRLDVAEVYPARIPELWAGRPVVLFGRYAEGGKETITIRGTVEGEKVSWPLEVELPQDQPQHDQLAKVWARQHIEDLMHQAFYADSPAVEEAVTGVALDYKLMSPYTSFVAVDEKDAEQLKDQQHAQPPRRMLVPVPLPEGTQWEGFSGPLGGEPDELVLLDSVKGLLRFRTDAPNVQSRFVASRERQRSITERLARPMLPQVKQAAKAPAQQQPALNFHAGLRPAAASGPAPGSAGGFGGMAGMGGGLGMEFKRPGANGIAGRPGEFAARRENPFRGGGVRQFAERAEAADKPADASEALDGEKLYAQTHAALSREAQPLYEAAQQALAEGQKLLQDEKRDQARAVLMRAFVLDTAAALRGYGNGPFAAQAQPLLEQIREQQLAGWRKETPVLGRRLDLVLRNVPLDEALKRIARAAKVEIDILPGSPEDAARLLDEDALRVSFLDLRGATLGEALEWLLPPLRLTWRPEGDGNQIIVLSERRGEGVSAWVYDVAALALPEVKPAKANDSKPDDAAARGQLAEQVKQAADEFLKAVQAQLKGTGEAEITWYVPGRLLVIGDRKTHARAAELFDILANVGVKVEGRLVELHQKTTARAMKRADWEKNARRSKELLETFDRHASFAWPLLSAAAAGQLDLEALTELQIAFDSEATKTLLDKGAAFEVLRSAWAVNEAARALDEDDEELTALARRARTLIKPAAERALASLKKDGGDVVALAETLYAALTLGDEFRDRARARLAERAPVPVDQSPIAQWGVVSQALLAAPGAVPEKELRQLVDAQPRGTDLVVLTALACRRAGDDAWQSFRTAAGNLVGGQPLPGEVVVLIHRLDGRSLLATNVD